MAMGRRTSFWYEPNCYIESRSLMKSATVASEGILQSPRGESDTEPTFGPSGKQERLNCWLKNRQ